MSAELTEITAETEALVDVEVWLEVRGLEISPAFATSGNTGKGEFISETGNNGPRILEVDGGWSRPGWLSIKRIHAGGGRYGGFVIPPGGAMKLQERDRS